MAYSRTNLVLCTQSFRSKTEDFREGKMYRCIEAFEGIEHQFLIYGVVFDKEGFDKLFEYAHDAVMREFTQLGLIKDGKLVSKTAMGELLHVQTYGKGHGAYRAAYLCHHPKDLCYQFGASFRGDNKATLMGQIRFDLEKIIAGDVEPLDDMDIHRGNSGYPLQYANIYWKPLKETVELVEIIIN